MKYLAFAVQAPTASSSEHAAGPSSGIYQPVDVVFDLDESEDLQPRTKGVMEAPVTPPQSEVPHPFT